MASGTWGVREGDGVTVVALVITTSTTVTAHPRSTGCEQGRLWADGVIKIQNPFQQLSTQHAPQPWCGAGTVLQWGLRGAVPQSTAASVGCGEPVVLHSDCPLGGVAFDRNTTLDDVKHHSIGLRA